MSAYVLFTAGTLDDRRSAWLAEFTSREGSSTLGGLPPFAVSARSATDAPPFWSLDDLARQAPSAQCVVFVEPASVGLSVALATGLHAGAQQWLADWRANARKLLHRVQDDPSRFLLVDAHEAGQHPLELAQALAARFQLTPSPGLAALPPVQVDALCEVLAQALANAEPDVQALLAELQASCTPLAPDQAWPDADRVRPASAEAAASRLAELQSTAGRADDTAEAAQAAHELASSRQENELLLLQIQHLHEELQFALAAPPQAAPAPPQMPETLEAPLAPGPVDAELLSALEALAALRAENELLTQQAWQIQEELGHYHAKSRALEADAALSVAGVSALQVTIGDVVPDVERTSPPYRELLLTLRDLRIAGRHVPEAAVRLVEHHGHPGLVVFANTSGPQLFANWREAGREGDRTYALLVPSDANSRPTFDAMDSIDWILLQAIAARIERVTRTAGSRTSLLWGHLARRFRQQLQEMPARFRWASVAFAWLPNAGANTLSCRFELVQYGSREVPNLALQWIVDSPRAGLELLCDIDAGPPLLSWPENIHGQLPDRLRMPVGPSAGTQEAERDYWSRLTQPDRDFVVDLLSTWPEVIAQLPGGLPGAALSGADLAAEAVKLKRQLRNEAPVVDPVVAARRPPSLARRVVRRLARMAGTQAA